MADKILFIILCLSVFVVVSQSVEVTGNCSTTRIPEPFTVTGVDRPTLNCDLFLTSSCSNGNLPEHVSGPFMGPPAYLHLESVLYPFNGNLFPKLIVTWKPPNTAAGINELKGFYMKVDKVSGVNGEPYVCRVFDMSQNNFTIGDHRMQFSKTFVQFLGGADYLYNIELYTLPYSEQYSEKVQAFFSLQASQSENNTGDWLAAMTYTVQNLTAPAQISIQFSLAPRRFNFQKYRLQLIDKRDDKNAFLTCEISVIDAYECQGMAYDPVDPDATSFTHTFVDVPAGNYNVWLQPRDPFWQTEGKCLCYQIGKDHTRSCVRCLTTELRKDITIEGPIPTTSTSTSTSTSTESYKTPSAGEIKGPNNPEDQNWKILAAVLGSVGGLILITVILLGVWRRRQTGDFILPFISRRKNNEDTSDLPKKKICIVYTSDHNEHVNVIDKFARYLNDHCHCQVYFMPWFRGEMRNMGCYQWIMEHINMADYVLIICSEAAFKLYEGRNNNTSFQMENKGPEEDMFPIAMSHVMAGSLQPNFYTKNILAYFEYTSEDFLIKDFSPGIQYKLMTHLKELLFHIHEIEAYGNDKRRYIIDRSLNVQSKLEGKSLLEAITKAKHFQKNNPFWFWKNFPRQDSTYGSASSPDLESASTIHGGFVFNENATVVTSDPEAMSTVTYDTQFHKNHSDFAPLAPSTVATTTAPTEFVEDQLAQIDHQGVNLSFVGESSPDEFSPPSDVDVDDIDYQLMKINQETESTNENGLNQFPNANHAYQNPNFENIPDVSCNDNNSEISDVRDA